MHKSHITDVSVPIWEVPPRRYTLATSLSYVVATPTELQTG